MAPNVSNVLKKAALFSSILAIIFSVIAMYIALDHNPMGEYCEFVEPAHSQGECDINWSHWLILGGISFAWIFVMSLFVLSISIFAYQKFLRK